MTAERSIDADGVVAGAAVRHGTGVNSNRAFPTDAYPAHIDPFVLFERFYIDPDTGFPMHPHRGFEIVSYMLDGGMAHADSLGVEHTARVGGAMRITTGSGIRHAEFPAGDAACNGLQLWVNLSRAEKEVDADYADASSEELPTTSVNGATVTTVVGDGSPLSLQTPMEYLDARVTDEWTWTVPAGWAGFIYGVTGDGTVGGDAFGEGDVYPIESDPADRQITVVAAGDSDTLATDPNETRNATEPNTRTADAPLRVVAVAGRPHNEPIRLQGPFVL